MACNCSLDPAGAFTRPRVERSGGKREHDKCCVARAQISSGKDCSRDERRLRLRSVLHHCCNKTAEDEFFTERAQDEAPACDRECDPLRAQQGLQMKWFGVEDEVGRPADRNAGKRSDHTREATREKWTLEREAFVDAPGCNVMTQHPRCNIRNENRRKGEYCGAGRKRNAGRRNGYDHQSCHENRCHDETGCALDPVTEHGMVDRDQCKDCVEDCLDDRADERADYARDDVSRDVEEDGASWIVEPRMLDTPVALCGDFDLFAHAS